MPKKSVQIRKRSYNMQRTMVMNAMAVLMLTAGILYLVTIIGFGRSAARFRDAVAAGEWERADGLALRFPFRYPPSARYLEAREISLETGRRLDRLDRMEGLSAAPAAQRAAQLDAEAEEALRRRKMDEAVKLWNRAAALLDRILAEAVTLRAVITPPLTNALFAAETSDASFRVERRPDENGVVQVTLPGGALLLSVSHPQCAPWRETLEVSPETGRRVERRIELQWRPGEAQIVSTPPARIWSGGREIGRSGEWLSLPAGDQTVTLKAEGRRPRTLRLTVRPDERTVESAVLEREQGAVLLRAVVPSPAEDPAPAPEWGVVRIGEGPPRRMSLPALLEALPPGPVALALEAPGCRAGEPETVVVRDAETNVVNILLEPLPVRVTLRTTPATEAAIVDAEGTVLGRAGEPLELRPFVSHALGIYADGYEPALVVVAPRRFGGRMPDRVVELTEEAPDRFARGATSADVRRLQGDPDRIEHYRDRYAYRYGPNTVVFDRADDKVLRWENADGSLKTAEGE
jgi:hypothetical protein